MGPHFLLFPQSLELWPTPKIPLLGDLQRDSLHQQNWLPMAQSTQRFAAVGQRLSLLSHLDTQRSLATQINFNDRQFPFAVEVVGRSGESHGNVTFYGRQMNNPALLARADVSVI